MISSDVAADSNATKSARGSDLSSGQHCPLCSHRASGEGPADVSQSFTT